MLIRSLFLGALFSVSTLVGGVFSPLTVAQGEDARWVVDSSKSKVNWQGSKVVGGGHHGTLKIQSGWVELKGDLPHRAEVVVDMKSLVNEDLKDPSRNKKLVGHLHSDDFFSTDTHPTSRLKISSFKKGASEGEYTGKGTLTVKNIEKPVELNLKVSRTTENSQEVRTDLKFDRTEFDVRYGSGKFFEDLGDRMIADDVELRVNVHLVPEKS